MEKQVCDTCTLEFENLAKVSTKKQLLWLAKTQSYSGLTIESYH